MVWYFYQSQNKIQKKKGKIKQKIKGKPYLSPRRSRPSQPTRPTRGRGVFFHLPRTQAARWNATEPARGDTSSSTSFQAAPCPLLAPGRTWRLREFIPPLPSAYPPLPR